VVFAKQSSSVFNQLPCSRLERGFGRRNAISPGVEWYQMPEERLRMTIDTGVQRKLIFTNGIVELLAAELSRA
jgi:hypothetical protein